METIITVKRRVDESTVRFSQKLLGQDGQSVKVRRIAGVELPQDFSGCLLFFHYGRIGNIHHFPVPSLFIGHDMFLLSAYCLGISFSGSAALAADQPSGLDQSRKTHACISRGGEPPRGFQLPVRGLPA